MNKAKRNKRITAICAAFMFALLSIFAVLATQNRTAYKMEVEYAAKAEEAAQDNSVNVYPDRKVLDNENLFDISLIDFSATSSPRNASMLNDDSLVCSMYGLGLRKKLGDLCPRLKAGETYTFSCWLSSKNGRDILTNANSASGDWRLASDKNDYLLYLFDFAYNEKYNGVSSGTAYFLSRTVKITEEMLSARIFIYAGTGDRQGECVWSKIMCNKGTEALPYQRNIDSLMNFAYKDGVKHIDDNKYMQGYEDGKRAQSQSYYEEGYSDGYTAAGSGTFTNLFTAVIDAPVQAFTNLLDFEILGVDMKKFALALVSIALVLAIVRFVLGKS